MLKGRTKIWDYLTVYSKKKNPKLKEVVKKLWKNLDLFEDNTRLLLAEAEGVKKKLEIAEEYVLERREIKHILKKSSDSEPDEASSRLCLKNAKPRKVEEEENTEQYSWS